MSHIITQGVRRDFELADHVALAILADSLDDDGRHAEATVFRGTRLSWSPLAGEYSHADGDYCGSVRLTAKYLVVQAEFRSPAGRVTFSASRDGDGCGYDAAMMLSVWASICLSDSTAVCSFLIAYLGEKQGKKCGRTARRARNLRVVQAAADRVAYLAELWQTSVE